MRRLGMVLIIAVGATMLQGCATPTRQSSGDGTWDRAQVPAGDGMVLGYVERQMRPGTTLRFR